MKQKIEVNLTREEVQSYHKQILKASTEDKKWFFDVGFSENQIEEMEDYCKDKLDKREYKDVTKAYPYLEHRIWSKMHIKPSTIGEFEPESLSILPEVIQAFRGKLCELMGLAGYKPKQKTLLESE